MKKFTTFIKSINMKIAAIILNCILIVSALSLIGGGWGKFATSGDKAEMFFSLACPIFNIFVLAPLVLPKESWIALYFKRRKLEEQQKIDELNKKNEQKNNK